MKVKSLAVEADKMGVARQTRRGGERTDISDKSEGAGTGVNRVELGRE